MLDVPEDVAHDTFPFDAADLTADPRYEKIPALRCRPDGAAVAEAAALLARAQRPIILAGGGVHLSGAAEQLQAFAEALTIPVAHTLTGKGAIACTHPLSAGIFGRYSRIANDLIEAADCILVVGCKLGEIATRRYTVPPPGKPLIHLDITAEEIGRCYPPTVALWGDARAGLEDLLAAMPEPAPRADYAAEVRDRMAAWRREVAARLASDEVPVGMARLMAELGRALPEDGILIADGGFAAHWGGLLFDSRRPGRSFVPDRGFASIGYGVPGAIGAKLGAPERPVVALTGDGGLNMALGELETARRLGLAIVVVVVNNAASGYVKALQHLMYGPGAYQSSDLSETDYAAVARALGCDGIRIERPGDLAGALDEALAATSRPVVLDVVVTRDPARMLPGVDFARRPADAGRPRRVTAPVRRSSLSAGGSAMQDLFAAARLAFERAHAPYSGFHVGAAVRGASGKVYAGANVENASYPEGNCAETSALAALVAAGERRITEALVMAAGPALCTPCGGCRQRLAEFARAGGPGPSVRPGAPAAHGDAGRAAAAVVQPRGRGAQRLGRRRRGRRDPLALAGATAARRAGARLGARRHRRGGRGRDRDRLRRAAGLPARGRRRACRQARARAARRGPGCLPAGPCPSVRGRAGGFGQPAAAHAQGARLRGADPDQRRRRAAAGARPGKCRADRGPHQPARAEPAGRPQRRCRGPALSRSVRGL